MSLIDPALPLIDLHRHLDGGLRLTSVLELAELHGVELPARDLEGLRPYVVVDGRERDLMTFIGRFRYLTAVLADADACRRVAYECVEDASREGLHYVELRFSPYFMAEPHGLDLEAVVEAVLDGVEAGSRSSGLPVRLIGTLSRTYGAPTALLELMALLARSDRLRAIDLAGDEARFPAELFREHFRRARDAGLRITVHAGEAAGPESVWAAIRDLGATRIGHAVRASEDPALLGYMAEHRIGVEANLTSNVQTRTVAGYGAHPAADQLARGIPVTLNTDDPTISGIDLRYEYETAAPQAGFGREEVRQLQQNALEIAYLSAAEKETLTSEARGRAAGTA